MEFRSGADSLTNPNFFLGVAFFTAISAAFSALD